MTKKQFIALADMIREHNRVAEQTGDFPKFGGAHLEALADFCREQNPRFMYSRWIDYIAGKCGKNGGKVAA